MPPRRRARFGGDRLLCKAWRCNRAPGYEASLLTGIGGPRETPADIIAVINRKTNSALADQIKARAAALGITVLSCYGQADGYVRSSHQSQTCP
jgi:hypothetical protein